MPKGKGKKSPWADLPEEFKTEIDNSDEAQCRKRLADVGIAQDLLMRTKKLDEDLIAKVEAAKFAGQMYRDGTKANKLKTRYIVERLKSQGKCE